MPIRSKNIFVGLALLLTFTAVVGLFQNCSHQHSDTVSPEAYSENLSASNRRVKDLEMTLRGLIDTERSKRLSAEKSLQDNLERMNQRLNAFEFSINSSVSQLTAKDQQLQVLIETEKVNTASAIAQVNEQISQVNSKLQEKLMQLDLNFKDLLKQEGLLQQSRLETAVGELLTRIAANEDLYASDRESLKAQLAQILVQINELKLSQQAFETNAASVYATKGELAALAESVASLKLISNNLDLKISFTKQEILSQLGEEVRIVNDKVEAVSSRLTSVEGDVDVISADLTAAVSEYRSGFSDFEVKLSESLNEARSQILFIVRKENHELKEDLFKSLARQSLALTLYVNNSFGKIVKKIEELENKIADVEKTSSQKAEALRAQLVRTRVEMSEALLQEQQAREELNSQVQLLISGVLLMQADLEALQRLTQKQSDRIDRLTSDFESEKTAVAKRFKLEREDTDKALEALRVDLKGDLLKVQQMAADLVKDLGAEIQTQFKTVVGDIALLKNKQASFDNQLKVLTESVQQNRAKTLELVSQFGDLRRASLAPLVLSRERLAQLQIEFIGVLNPQQGVREPYLESFRPLMQLCQGDADATFPNAMGLDAFQILSIEYIRMLVSGERSGKSADEIFHGFGGVSNSKGFYRQLTLGISKFPVGLGDSACMSRVQAWAREMLISSQFFASKRADLAKNPDLARAIENSYLAMIKLEDPSQKLDSLLLKTLSDLKDPNQVLESLRAEFVAEWIDLADSEVAMQERIDQFNQMEEFQEQVSKDLAATKQQMNNLRNEFKKFEVSTNARLTALESQVGGLTLSMKRALDVLLTLSSRSGFNDLRVATLYAGDAINYKPELISTNWEPKVAFVQHFFNGPLSLKNGTDACTGAKILESGGVRGAAQFGRWGSCWVNFRSFPMKSWASEAKTLWFRVFGAGELVEIKVDPLAQVERRDLYKNYNYSRVIDFRNLDDSSSPIAQGVKLNGRFDKGVFDFPALDLLDVYIKSINNWGGIVISFFTLKVEKVDGKEVIKRSKEFKYNIQLYSPLVVDTKGRGQIRLTSLVESRVSFALQDHTESIRTGWVENGDVAFLALDKDGDGEISSGLELFGDGTEVSPGKLAKDGFAALKIYDLNQDSRIDSSDEVFKHLKLWWDYNNSGRVEEGELESLVDSGIRYLSLNAVKVEGAERWNEGNLVDTMSKSDVKLYDVFFLTQPH